MEARPRLYAQLIFEDHVDNEIISYIEMCQREASSLQRGMNFELGEGYSVILMSVHPCARYRDRVEDDGTTLTRATMPHDLVNCSIQKAWISLNSPLLAPQQRMENSIVRPFNSRVELSPQDK